MEARGWRGPPVCRETIKLHLGVQLLADRLVSTQLTSSEAGKKMGSMDPGRQLSASRDDLPRSGLSRPQKQLNLFAGMGRILSMGQCQTLQGFSTLLCVPDIRREE